MTYTSARNTAAKRPSPSGVSRRTVVVGLGLGLAVILVFAGLKAITSGDALSGGGPLPRIAAVPAFSLIERSGKTVTHEDLRGFVWIADFIFTRCPGPCPELSLRMRSLQEGIRRFDGRVRLVSFSVDPLYDRPAVLRKYAQRYRADQSLWWFLTGDDEPGMHDLVQRGFLQALSPAREGAPIIHSTRFVLVDQAGHIRAFYDGLDPGSKRVIVRAVERLLAESAG